MFGGEVSWKASSLKILDSSIHKVQSISIFSVISLFSTDFSYHYFKDILSEEQNKINSYNSYPLNMYYFLQPLEIKGSDVMEKHDPKMEGNVFGGPYEGCLHTIWEQNRPFALTANLSYTTRHKAKL